MDRVRKARNEKVVMSCASGKDLQMARERIQQREDLLVHEPKMHNPLVCIKGVPSALTNEDLIQQLKAQNKHILQDTEPTEIIKVRYRKRSRNAYLCNPVLEVSPRVWSCLVNAAVVHIDIKSGAVEDQSPLVQCTRCLCYGHTKSLCKETSDLCSHCGEAHTRATCPARTENIPAKCINCERTKREDRQHNAFSGECRERMKWDLIARSRVAYS